jgi:hypothetical protein
LYQLTIPDFGYSVCNAGNRVAKIVDKDGEVTTNRYIRDAGGNVMAVYQDTLTLEHHLYGSSRLGLALGEDALTKHLKCSKGTIYLNQVDVFQKNHFFVE